MNQFENYSLNTSLQPSYYYGKGEVEITTSSQKLKIENSTITAEKAGVSFVEVFLNSQKVKIIEIFAKIVCDVKIVPMNNLCHFDSTIKTLSVKENQKTLFAFQIFQNDSQLTNLPEITHNSPFVTLDLSGIWSVQTDENQTVTFSCDEIGFSYPLNILVEKENTNEENNDSNDESEENVDENISNENIDDNSNDEDKVDYVPPSVNTNLDINTYDYKDDDVDNDTDGDNYTDDDENKDDGSENQDEENTTPNYTFSITPFKNCEYNQTEKTLYANECERIIFKIEIRDENGSFSNFSSALTISSGNIQLNPGGIYSIQNFSQEEEITLSTENNDFVFVFKIKIKD